MRHPALRSLSPITLAATVALVAPGAAIAADPPDWVRAGGATPKRPRQEYVTGFAMVEGGAALERAKVQAAADLARSLTVRVQSELSDVTAEKNGAAEYSVAAFTRATSDIRLEGLAYETYSGSGASYALAYVKRADAARGQRRLRDDAAAKAKALAEEAKRLESEKEDGAALTKYFAAKRPVAEALEHDATVRAIAAAEATDTQARDGLIALTRVIEDGVRKLLKRPIQAFADVSAVLALQLEQQGISAKAGLTVEAPTYGSTSFTSPFARQLAAELERALAASSAPAGAGPVVLRGSYIELDADVEVTVLARDVKGGALASAQARLPLKVVPASLPVRPQNFADAMAAQKLFAHGEDVSGSLKLEAWTNKGERNLVFDEGDEVKLFLRVNRPAYVRLIYLLANGLRVPLEQKYFIDASKVNRAVEYPDAFVVTPPFGVEHIYATAFTVEPAPLPTKKTMVGGEEYEVIADELSSVVVKTRGLKKKDVAAETAEATFTLTTMAKR